MVNLNDLYHEEYQESIAGFGSEEIEEVISEGDEDDTDDEDNEDRYEYGTAWCPYCDARIDFFGCEHVVYNFDATNCRVDDIDNDLMEVMVYLILDNLPKYSEELSFFPSFEINHEPKDDESEEDESEEDEFDIIRRLLIGRERTEELDDFIYDIKKFILELRYQDFENILDSFHFQNPDDYCMIEILDTDNRSYCDGRAFGMAKNSQVFEPGLVPLREKYGWLEVV